MRIAFLCADAGVPVFGSKGASIHVQEMVRAFRRLGFEVELFAARRGDAPPADLQGVKVHEVSPAPTSDPAARERAALAANGRLRAELLAAGPFDLVYERYSLWSHAGMESAARWGVPAILEVNAPLVEEQARYRELHDAPAAERVAVRAFSSATTVVAVSSGVAEWVRRTCASANVHVVPNGVDPDRFHPRPPAAPAADRPFVVGFLGSLKPWHGVDRLVEAFALLRESRERARLLVVGDGPEREALCRALHSAGVADGAELAGAVDPTRVPALLEKMDVGVAPYPALEDFYFSPLKVVEYMAAGLPVVASRIGDLPRWVVHGRTGLLCPPDRPAALADALGRIAADPALGRRLGQEGRRRVVSRHSWTAVARRILDLTDVPAATGRMAWAVR